MSRQTNPDAFLSCFSCKSKIKKPKKKANGTEREFRIWILWYQKLKIWIQIRSSLGTIFLRRFNVWIRM